MNGLLRGELLLTIDIIIGLLVAEVIIRLKISDIIMRRFIPRSIPAVTGLAIAISTGSCCRRHSLAAKSPNVPQYGRYSCYPFRHI